jgi:pantothenate kinase
VCGQNLELKRINSEKKAAQSGQIAAEATLRRVHAAQKDEDLPPIEAILAPLEAELKLARHEIARLQENNRALERLTKSKEAALVEAERTVEVAEAKATTVDCLQNQNQELLRQIEILQVVCPQFRMNICLTLEPTNFIAIFFSSSVLVFHEISCADVKFTAGRQ